MMLMHMTVLSKSNGILCMQPIKSVVHRDAYLLNIIINGPCSLQNEHVNNQQQEVQLPSSISFLSISCYFLNEFAFRNTIETIHSSK